MLHWVWFEALNILDSSSDGFPYCQGHCTYSVPFVLLIGQCGLFKNI